MLTLHIDRIFPKRASIMAKKEVQWMPLLGQWMALSRAVFVDRGNSAKAIRSLTAAGETIKARHTSLWMFPEGTRSMREHHDMLPFKKGAFHVAVEAGVPIVPVICENYWRLYRKSVFESGTIKVKGEYLSSNACTMENSSSFTLRSSSSYTNRWTHRRGRGCFVRSCPGDDGGGFARNFYPSFRKRGVWECGKFLETI
jgi:1-acyl-sn-glycerol-3-phosphate acyltransferase